MSSLVEGLYGRGGGGGGVALVWARLVLDEWPCCSAFCLGGGGGGTEVVDCVNGVCGKECCGVGVYDMVMYVLAGLC